MSRHPPQLVRDDSPYPSHESADPILSPRPAGHPRVAPYSSARKEARPEAASGSTPTKTRDTPAGTGRCFNRYPEPQPVEISSRASRGSTAVAPERSARHPRLRRGHRPARSAPSAAPARTPSSSRRRPTACMPSPPASRARAVIPCRSCVRRTSRSTPPPSLRRLPGRRR